MKDCMNTMKRNDIILVGSIILAVLLYFGGLQWYQNTNGNDHRFAVIKQNQKVIERIDLDAVTEPREITLPGNYHETILVEKGRIRFKEADCPDHICVKTGWLQEPGDTAVCLPNRAVISIED